MFPKSFKSSLSLNFQTYLNIHSSHKHLISSQSFIVFPLFYASCGKKVSISWCGIMLIWRKPNATVWAQAYRIGITRAMLAWNGGDLESKFWFIRNSISSAIGFTQCPDCWFPFWRFRFRFAVSSNHVNRFSGRRSAWLALRRLNCSASRPTLASGVCLCLAATLWSM